MKHTSLPRLAVPAALSFLIATSWAQSPPAKPAAKPPAPAAPSANTGRITSMGTPAKESPLLTREELRACFKQRDALATRLKDSETARTALDAERAALTQTQAALRTEREGMVGMKGAVDALNAKTKAFQEDVDAWNKAVAEFNEGKLSGREAEARRNQLSETQADLKKRQTELQTERADLVAKSEDVIKAFNAKAADVDLKVAEWNDRNRKFNTDTEMLQKDRDAWSVECGDRRYREDDEKAILSGR